MRIAFSKMQGLGNDFVVIDAINQKIDFDKKTITRLADRHFGIGFDQLLIVRPKISPRADFFYQIFNANGQEVSQCGNGARCLARFIVAKKISDKQQFNVETNNTLIALTVKADNTVSATVAKPIFKPENIPFIADKQALNYTIDGHLFGVLSLGNPHAVLLVDDVEKAAVAEIGRAMQKNPLFPEQVNVGFAQVIDRKTLRLRVFERGVGETKACASGACAAAVYAMRMGLIDDAVTIHLNGGDLAVTWRRGEKIIMTGAATFVFEGDFLL